MEIETDGIENLTAVDLFCGAGGLSLGLVNAGFEILLAADCCPTTVETHRHNLGTETECKPLTPGADLPWATVFVGGPPCQGFSSAGPRRQNDARNTLVGVFAELVARYRPTAFIFENVEGFLTADAGRYVVDLLEPVLAAGYHVHLQKLNAANYGVPQLRKRVVAIGLLGASPTFPTPSHTAYGAPGAGLASVTLPRTPTVSEALAGLPPATAEAPGLLADHHFRPLQGQELLRAQALRQGQTMRDLPEDLWHATFRRRAYRRVMDGTPTERRGGAPSGLRRLSGSEPSKAITSGARTEFLHPVEDRFLTLRECARLQTFPDTFQFHGTQSEKALQIGNAVPPRLAHAIASALKEDLRSYRREYEEGALMSFLPTLSEGMSPALKATADMVCEKFNPASIGKEQMLLWD